MLLYQEICDLYRVLMDYDRWCSLCGSVFAQRSGKWRAKVTKQLIARHVEVRVLPGGAKSRSISHALRATLGARLLLSMHHRPRTSNDDDGRGADVAAEFCSGLLCKGDGFVGSSDD